MIKSSEIANFLDLIKHITDTQKHTQYASPKKNSKTRYQDHEREEKHAKNHQQHSLHHETNSTGPKSVNPYQQHKLKMFASRRKNHRSFHYDPAPSRVQSEQEVANQSCSGVVRERKNLFQLYCQDLQKKRQEKVKDTLFGKVAKENSSKPNWQEEAVAELQKCSGAKNLFREKSMPPIGRAKLAKGVIESIRGQLEVRRKKGSTKKIQPSELSIGTIGEFRMPRITQNSSHAVELKDQTQKIARLHFSRVEKKIKIVKNHEISGWAQEDDHGKFFHPDLF